MGLLEEYGVLLDEQRISSIDTEIKEVKSRIIMEYKRVEIELGKELKSYLGEYGQGDSRGINETLKPLNRSELKEFHEFLRYELEYSSEKNYSGEFIKTMREALDKQIIRRIERMSIYVGKDIEELYLAIKKELHKLSEHLNNEKQIRSDIIDKLKTTSDKMNEKGVGNGG